MFKRFSYLVFLSVLIFSACSKKKYRPPEKMNMEELQTQAQTCIEQGAKGLAARYLEAMLDQYPDHKDIAKHRLTLADIYFEKRNYESADQCYEKFVRDNPSNSEYAAYRSILSKFYQTLSVDRDSTMILRSLDQAKRYLAVKEYASSKYSKDVKDIIYTCERKIIDREVYLYSFYLRQGKFKSAKNRLKYIYNTYLEKHPDIEPRLLYLESKLAFRDKKKDIAAEKMNVLMKKFPESQYTAMADRMLNTKKEFIFF